MEEYFYGQHRWKDYLTEYASILIDLVFIAYCYRLLLIYDKLRHALYSMGWTKRSKLPWYFLGNNCYGPLTVDCLLVAFISKELIKLTEFLDVHRPGSTNAHKEKLEPIFNSLQNCLFVILFRSSCSIPGLSFTCLSKKFNPSWSWQTSKYVLPNAECCTFSRLP